MSKHLSDKRCPTSQCDFEDYDVPNTSRRLNDVTPEEWDSVAILSATEQLQLKKQKARYKAALDSYDKAVQSEQKKLKSLMFKPAQDENVNKVVDAYLVRAEAGMNKYGVTTSANPLDLIEWLTHAQEEAMDFTIYIQRIIEELEKSKELNK